MVGMGRLAGHSHPARGSGCGGPTPPFPAMPEGSASALPSLPTAPSWQWDSTTARCQAPGRAFDVHAALDAPAIVRSSVGGLHTRPEIPGDRQRGLDHQAYGSCPPGQAGTRLHGDERGSAGLPSLPMVKVLASSDADGRVNLWDWSKGRRLAALRPERLPLVPGSTDCVLSGRQDARGRKPGSPGRSTPGVRVPGSGSSALGGSEQLITAIASVEGRQDDRHRRGGWPHRSGGNETGLHRAESREHQGMVSGLALSPDGRKLVSAGTDRTVRRWTRESGS